MDRIRSIFGRFRFGGGGAFALFVFGLFFASLVAWLATGFYTVQPGERGSLRLLGRFVSTSEAGLHWFWPSPVGTRDIVAVDEVRSLEVGVRGNAPVLDESLMITGDENIVDVQLQVQYDINDIELFLFRVKGPRRCHHQGRRRDGSEAGGGRARH